MGLGQVLGVSAEGQQKPQSLHPHKTSDNTLTNNKTPLELDLAPVHPCTILCQAPLQLIMALAATVWWPLEPDEF